MGPLRIRFGERHVQGGETRRLGPPLNHTKDSATNSILPTVTALQWTLSSRADSATTAADRLAERLASPPASAKPWVYWFWINGNISTEGITADLAALHRAGVLWMEVSGPWGAPEGQVKALSPQWHEAFQWAVRECDRLGLQFDVSVDFGYGSGGPHISPELSMQKLY
jgi:hypothetical protein